MNRLTNMILPIAFYALMSVSIVATGFAALTLYSEFRAGELDELRALRAETAERRAREALASPQCPAFDPDPGIDPDPPTDDELNAFPPEYEGPMP